MGMEDNFQDTVFHQLDFKHEILDSDKRLFMLIAGVGAGKNFWVKSLKEKGHEDKGYAPNGYKVLLITSRATTADAQAIKLDADKRFDFNKLFDYGDWWGDGPPVQKVVCCTNSYIEWYVKNLYSPADPKTHVWNMFDFIVLDEAHSMTCDATFSEAPFHTQSFLRHAYRSSKTCRIVLMSGTPEPVTWLYMGIQNEESVKVINLYKQCRHIEPKLVQIHPAKFMVDDIVYRLKAGDRIIYFATRSDSMKKLIEELNARGITNDNIGISYSDDEKKDAKFPPELVEKKVLIQKSLEKKEVLPPEVRIFITTSKNKEGININDTDVKSMVVESHQRDEVRQMAGRVRNGLEYLIIDRDAAQHSSAGSPLMYQICRACIGDVNDTFCKYWEKRGGVPNKEQLQSQIKKVEDAFRYLRYDYFEEKFRVYVGRQKGDKLAYENEYDFQQYITDWEEEEYTGNSYGREQLQAWFPKAKTDLYSLYSLKEEVAKLFKERGVFGRRITKAERDDLAEEIRKLVKICEQTDSKIKEDFSNFGDAIKQLGYKSQEAPNVRKGTQYIISEL